MIDVRMEKMFRVYSRANAACQQQFRNEQRQPSLARQSRSILCVVFGKNPAFVRCIVCAAAIRQ